MRGAQKPNGWHNCRQTADEPHHFWWGLFLLGGRRMHARPSAIGAWLRKDVNGYYQYHAVPETGNLRQLSTFRQRINRLWYQVLACRSQRARRRWECDDYVTHSTVTIC